VFGKPESFGRTWRFFRSVVLGLSAASWLLLTIYIAERPVGSDFESPAVAQLRTINTAELTYREYPAGHDGTYGTIPDLIKAGLLDSSYDSPIHGYVLNVAISGGNYTATAMPTSTNAGRYGYYSESDSVIRYARTVTETCKPCYPKGESGAPVG
jgi:hypothetical protein